MKYETFKALILKEKLNQSDPMYEDYAKEKKHEPRWNSVKRMRKDVHAIMEEHLPITEIKDEKGNSIAVMIDPEALFAYLRTLDPEIAALTEATFLWYRYIYYDGRSRRDHSDPSFKKSEYVFANIRKPHLQVLKNSKKRIQFFQPRKNSKTYISFF